ncbi:hypothetical protein B0J12DRAFT_662490 [Macrophomina phaseolina]|uniref:Guanine nucleotide-exchange factor SEC12 n=1 Tax=Macrophomina phaseolina TaxID=35725 RepID=A0ABQ8GC11_9PEZI|nr:hypothetical protein B0J12DRAFT_662490 [Macrophomina phaseolina]
MAPTVSFTKITLPYPIFSADFDPYNRGYLVVGGGGGEGRSGVPNSITLLDVSSRGSIEVAAELDLKLEDAVMTLANLASKDGLITFAGINSSEEERVADKNKHLRSFKIDYPPRKNRAAQEDGETETKAQKGSIAFLGKTQLFIPPKEVPAKKENYQRLLRLSPAQKRESGSKRIGAIASANFSPVSELVIFDATTAVPSDWDVIQRIRPKDGKDVNDVDICETSESEFSVAYCTDHQVFVARLTYDFAKKKTTSITSAEDPIPAYTLPFPDVFKKGSSRPTIKHLRFLTPHHILLCCNHPQRKGAELLVLRKLPDTPGEVIWQKRLPSRIKAAGGLDVCALNADPETGAQQIVIAVAGQDISIELYTIEYSGKKTDILSRLNSYTTLRDVHPIQMTKLAFSPFHSPWQSSSPDKNHKTPGPQYLRLASTSLGNTVVVDTFTLTPLDPKKPHARYVLKGGPSVLLDRSLPILVIGFSLLVALLCLQQYLNFMAARSGQQPFTLIRLPQSVQEYIANARGGGPLLPPGARQAFSRVAETAASAPPTASVVVKETVENIYTDAAGAAEEIVRKATTLHLRTLLEAYAPAFLKGADDLAPSPDDKAIVVRAGPTEEDPEAGELSTEVHASRADARRVDAHAKEWAELSEEQRGVWRQRLVRAGAWAVEEGERVLRGVLFSEYAGFVGRTAGEAIVGRM